jgi:glycosyltransferase involved in cell wall biosynthesis
LDIKRFCPTHFHLSAPDWLGTSAQAFAKTLGVPVVASLHTRFEAYLEYYNLTLLSRWMKRRLDRFYGASDFILTPNDALADTFRAKGMGDRIGIWGRGADRDIFTPSRRDMSWRRDIGYADEEVVILFFGRLVSEKGLDVFADTIELLRRRGRGLRPLVVGDGPSSEWMKSRLRSALFLGHLEGADLGRAVASADILVNPSVTEAFGNVNLEAMASGLAIVSADVDSARALAQDEREALLVDPKNPAAYADAVELLLEQPELRRRLGENSLAASADYVWPKVLESVVHAYRVTERSR